MAELVACLSTGKGTWGHVNRLISDGAWDRIILITNEYGNENFQKNDKTELICVDLNQGIRELRDEVEGKLKGRIKTVEVGLNVVSGTGKEHMALLSALLRLGVGVRLVALTKDGIEEI